MKEAYNFVIIGSGNLGTRLSIALIKSGHKAIQIISRNRTKARLLSDQLGASFGTELKIDDRADLVFIATGDDSIPLIASEMPNNDMLYIHLSGSTPITVFNKNQKNYGVLYPLMSFTAEREIDFSDIPILLEASSPDNYRKLKIIADSISNNVMEMNSEARLKCHIGAIIAANFSNHFICLGERYLKENNLPSDILHPLLDEMLSKIKAIGAEKSQTGPARRNDMGSVKKHIALLENDPHLQKMYKFVSESIVNFYK